MENYKFTNCYIKEDGSKRWRCSTRNCPATVCSDGQCSAILDTNGMHTHPSTVGATELQVARVACKRKAVDDLGSRPSKVMRTCLSEVSTAYFCTQDLRNLSRCVQRVRRLKYPPGAKGSYTVAY